MKHLGDLLFPFVITLVLRSILFDPPSVQADMKKYADRKRLDIEEYKVGDLVMLSTKDLKYQMVVRRTEKLTERFVGPYKIKEIVSSNAVKLELPSTVRIHPIVNISRIR